MDRMLTAERARWSEVVRLAGIEREFHRSIRLAVSLLEKLT
jgi:hypothetical protein